MTRVRLPPDPHSFCVTTIIDSQSGDVALLQQYQYQQVQQQLQQQQQKQQQHQFFADDIRTAGDESILLLSLPTPPQSESTATPTTSSSPSLIVDTVDSIVLVYDLDRMETFTRLENHWLPLIEQCYQGKVR